MGRKKKEPEVIVTYVDPSIEWLEPTKKESSIADNHTWVTRCGKYQIVRRMSKMGLPSEFVAVFKKHVWQHDGKEYDCLDFIVDPTAGGKYPMRYRKLKEAIIAIEEKHALVAGSVISNAKWIIRKAKEAGIAGLGTAKGLSPESQSLAEEAS